MKNKLIMLLTIMLFQLIDLSAQSLIDNEKYIEVTGSAEKMIKPDEIQLGIVLTEYTKDGAVVKLENIKKDFHAVLQDNHVDIENLQLNSLETNNWWYWWNNRNKNLKSETYSLWIKSDVNFLKLIEGLNKKWVESINIIEKKNKNIQNYRREVKIEAIRAAKEKATYLVESLGEHLGGLISVIENPEESTPWYSTRNALSNSIVNSNTSETDDINNVSSIKIRYEIKVKFAIK